MKNKLLFLLIVLFSVQVNAEGDQYEEAMKSQINNLNQATSVEQYQEAINGFERIASAEQDKWLPHYYAAYGYILMSTKIEEPEKKDKVLDLSSDHITEGLKLIPEESELHALMGFVYMMKVAVDPATRGPQLSGLSFQAFEKALKSNPNNPRAMYLLAQMKFGTAQFFGSDTSEACTLLEQSILAFEQQKPAGLAPTWGLNQALYMRKSCSSE